MFKIKNLLFYCFLILVFTIQFACSGENVMQAQDNPKIDAKVNLEISTFSYIPPQIKGCSCFLANNKAEFKKGDYIYINDFVVTSFLSINGVLTKFIMLNYKYINTKTSIATYKGGTYELIVEVNHLDKKKKDKDIKTGNLKLINVEGDTLVKSFYGECGC